MGQIFKNLTGKPLTMKYLYQIRDSRWQPTGRWELHTETIEPSGKVAELELKPCNPANIDGIPAFEMCGVKGLPEEANSTVYIVTPEVLAAVVGRTDVYAVAPNGIGLIQRSIPAIHAETDAKLSS